jgi:CubicO group peptidase (beta-lactamase class C family)
VADPIGGEVASGFERVRDAFERNFTDHGDVGAACSVYLDGEPVVDLWGGLADRDEARPWEHDTLALVFSSTKGVTAVCVHRLVERGEIDLDAPVAFYWPEFAARGKGDIPVRWILTHQAGLAAVEGDLTLEEVYAWQPVCAAIAAQEPNWTPGTTHGYHARSYGWILGELVRRVTGESLGRFFAREIAAPLDLDFHIGLPAEREKRVARLYPAPEPVDPQALALREQLMGPDTLLGRVLEGPSQLFSYGDMWNTRALREAEMPSSNGIGGARDLARMYAALVGGVDGVRLLAPKTVEDVTRIQVEGPDAVIQMPTRFGLGFMLPPTLGLACPPHSFGHPGAGGSLGFADPQRHLGFGYVMNQMQLGLTGDARATSLVEAVYTSLDA